MKFTLRSKLLIPTVFSIALGIFLVTGYSYMGAVREIRHQVDTALSREVSLSARLMDTWITARQTDLRTWAFQDVHVDALLETGYYGKSARRGAAGTLTDLLAGYPYYDQLLLSTPNGRIIATSTVSMPEAVRINDREYFKRSMEGEIFVSDIIVSRGTGERVFVISVPVMREKEVVGVLAGAVKLSYFSSLFVDEFQFGRDGYAFLSDQRGKVLTISRKHPSDFDHPTDIHFPEGTERTVIRELGGATRMFCFSELRTAPWHFAITLSLDEAFASSRTVGKYSLVVGLFILVIVSAVVNILFQQVVHARLDRMLKVMGKVERGRLDVSIKDDAASDEIGVLVKAFNTMITRLKTTLDNLTGEIRTRERAETELNHHRRNLEQLVRERTAKLEQEINSRNLAEENSRALEERLIRAEKMEALGRLAGGVAHDLNNILSGIVTYPDLLLLRLPPDSPLQKPLKTIKASGNRAAAIVEDLLTMARRGVSVRETVNLNTIVIDYLKSPEHEKLTSRHPLVTVETEFMKALPPIDGSPVHLSKTVMNLVSNAAEAMDDKGGKGDITIATKTVHMEGRPGEYVALEAGHYAVLSITDSGMGIAPSDRQRIFEPFFTSKKMGISGTGLGMAVVWGTVKDHKGHIDIQSAPGKGSTFTLYFPVTENIEAVPGSPSPAPPEFMGNGESILVVDDVAEQRDIASSLLGELGYRVASVASGEAALAYLRETPVDLLILDMIMEPDMDGLDTYLKIQEIRPGQRAVVASGFSETWRVKRILSMGLTEYIKKPYDIETIGIAVKRQLAGTLPGEN